jgi:hypothetical protein
MIHGEAKEIIANQSHITLSFDPLLLCPFSINHQPSTRLSRVA